MTQKVYFRITEAREYLESATGYKVPCSTLRFWEKELGLIIQRAKGGKRMYTQKDLELLLIIFKLISKYSMNLASIKKLFYSKELRVRLSTFLLQENFEFKALEYATKN